MVHAQNAKCLKYKSTKLYTIAYDVVVVMKYNQIKYLKYEVLLESKHAWIRFNYVRVFFM